ncbi:unnamed protein product [Thlaspi arvense]|uniref:Transcription factor TFIIB cyclin-like domain-containing protein n=1 Tax=Thlaspi arvense TaxID=13288 RepID=A0AAU9SHJ7_THLAR|nr:unnamed protein product [Thlaspi arvense]
MNRLGGPRGPRLLKKGRASRETVRVSQANGQKKRHWFWLRGHQTARSSLTQSTTLIDGLNIRGRFGCKSKAGIVIDCVARKISCSECGLDFGPSIVATEPDNGSSGDFLSLTLGNSRHRGSDPVSIATTEPMNTSSDDFLLYDLGNSQNRGSDPVSEATTEPNNDYVQKTGFDPLLIATTKPIKASSDDVTIAAMSDRLGLLATVKNEAIEISKKIKSDSRGVRRNVRFAACIYIACRLNHMALTIDEISSVADGASASHIANASRSIAEKLDLKCAPLMQIRASEFAKRFCSTLQMDSQVVTAAQEAAEASTGFVNRYTPSLFGQFLELSRCMETHMMQQTYELCFEAAVAAVVVYVIARVSYEKKLLTAIMEATGVKETTINETYKDLYPYLSTITPKWFANAKDLKKLDNKEVYGTEGKETDTSLSDNQRKQNAYPEKQATKLGSPGQDFLNLLFGKYTSNTALASHSCISPKSLVTSSLASVHSPAQTDSCSPLGVEMAAASFDVQGTPCLLRM